MLQAGIHIVWVISGGNPFPTIQLYYFATALLLLVLAYVMHRLTLVNAPETQGLRVSLFPFIQMIKPMLVPLHSPLVKCKNAVIEFFKYRY